MNFSIQTKSRNMKGQSLIDIPNEFVVFDLETTGLDPFYDEIIEIGAIKIVDSHIVDEFSTFVKPMNEIPTFITNLTGITNEMVKDSPMIYEVLPQFMKFIDNNILVGHNIHFDINFLYDNLIKSNQEPLKNDYVDTLRLSRFLLTNLHHHRLTDLTDYYNINNNGRHRSIRDSEMTLEVLQKLKEEIFNQYGSIENFKNELSRKKRGLKASDITTSKVNFNEDNLLFNKNVAITGILEKMSRKEAMQIVVDLGGFCEDRVTTRTDYLILGNNDYNPILKGNKSSKLLKAEELKLKGNDIEILSENIFYDLISDYIRENSIITTPSIIKNSSSFANDISKEVTLEKYKTKKQHSVEIMNGDEKEILNFFIKTAEKHEKEIKYSFMSDKAISFTLLGIEVGRIKFNGKKHYCRLFAGDFKEHEWENVENPEKYKIFEYIEDLFTYIDKEYKRYFIKYGDCD